MIRGRDESRETSILKVLSGSFRVYAGVLGELIKKEPSRKVISVKMKRACKVFLLIFHNVRHNYLGK